MMPQSLLLIFDTDVVIQTLSLKSPVNDDSTYLSANAQLGDKKVTKNQIRNAR